MGGQGLSGVGGQRGPKGIGKKRRLLKLLVVRHEMWSLFRTSKVFSKLRCEYD